jgi:MarR family transcriptional regulator, transcriptional regulator for hemolysin
MRMRFDEDVSKLGVTRAHWTLIAVVARYPGTTQKFVAQMLQISEVSAGRLIDKLCQEGLLRREASGADRRARSVYVTDRAKPLIEDISKVAIISENHAFAGMSDAELDELARMLAVVESNWSNQSTP